MDYKGRIKKGEHLSKDTEFKPGQHWRKPKPHWNKEWLEQEYVVKGRSANDIAEQNKCTENNILFWLHKHGITLRTMQEVRAKKRWGAKGVNNPMWRGGTSSERQSFCNSLDWAWAIKKVYGRDKKTCQRCGKQQTKRFKDFHIHHLISFKERDLRTNTDNLLLLCAKCHRWVHSKQNTSKEFLGAFQQTLLGR